MNTRTILDYTTKVGVDTWSTTTSHCFLCKYSPRLSVQYRGIRNQSNMETKCFYRSPYRVSNEP